jgi:hypothetical protein
VIEQDLSGLYIIENKLVRHNWPIMMPALA